jgi:hypothetical protein
MSKNKDFLKRIILLMFISLIFTIQVQAAQTVVSIGDVNVEAGDDVTATIMLSDVVDYGTGTIKVSYDKDIAQVTNVVGNSDSSVILWKAFNDDGYVSISAWNLMGTSGDIAFADITFNAIGSSGSTPLTLEVEVLANITYVDIPTTLDHGSLTIGSGPTPTETATPEPTETATPEPTETATPEPTETPPDGSTVSMKAVIKPAVSIVVTPSNVNFGTLAPGDVSDKNQLKIKNKGSTIIDVTSEVTDTAKGLYVSGLQINEAAWSAYNIQLPSSDTENADVQLIVPADYQEVGSQKGTLVFWAQQA